MLIKILNKERDEFLISFWLKCCITRLHYTKNNFNCLNLQESLFYSISRKLELEKENDFYCEVSEYPEYLKMTKEIETITKIFPIISKLVLTPLKTGFYENLVENFTLSNLLSEQITEFFSKVFESKTYFILTIEDYLSVNINLDSNTSQLVKIVFKIDFICNNQEIKSSEELIRGILLKDKFDLILRNENLSSGYSYNFNLNQNNLSNSKFKLPICLQQSLKENSFFFRKKHLITVFPKFDSLEEHLRGERTEYGLKTFLICGQVNSGKRLFVERIADYLGINFTKINFSSNFFDEEIKEYFKEESDENLYKLLEKRIRRSMHETEFIFDKFILIIEGFELLKESTNFSKLFLKFF
jgi:hypothetical protein